MVPVEGYRMCGNLKIRPKTDSERDAIRETIDILLNFQADAEECLTLLETAIRTGQAAIVKRLLKLDYRMSTAAHATSSETTIALLGHDRTIYLGRMQRQAVEAGDQTVLLQLIEKFGDALASVSPRKLCKLALSHDHFDMFRFLVSRYVSDINKIWHDETQEIGETLLQMACVLPICELDFCNHRECSRPASTQAISFLLQAGADPMREQTEDAWTKFQRALNSQRIEPQHIMSVWPTLRQLERHMPPSHAIDLRKAWRANSERKLRSKIDEEISRQPISLYSATSESGLASNDSCDVTEIQQQARTDLTTGVAHQQPPRAAPTPRPNEVEFKHSPLTGPYKSAIRILTLQPSEEFDALIECLVTEVDLAELPFYKTLSYVWGTKSASKYISVNGKTLRIFENLHDALKRLRNTSGPQNLWIDAICIDQDNFGERSRQVEIMGDIYRHARGVVIWLGEHAEDSQYCFQDEVSVYKMNARAKAAFDRLCQREWFFRTWVIQELALSKCAFIKCGPDTADWDHFFPRGLGGLGFHPLHGWDSWDRIEELNWLRLPGSGEYVRLPNYSRSCRSTDPKDRVCGILGLFPPGLMRVHYNLTLQEVFTQFASAVIQWTGNIRLIHDYSVRDTLPGLPSWVPDFNSMTLAGTLPRKDSHFVERLNKKAASLAVNGRQLLIKGMVVDSIKQIGSEMFISTEYAVGTPAFRRVMLEWETQAASLDEKRFFMDAVSDAFLTTIVAFDPFESFLPLDRKQAAIWYRSCGTGLLGTKEPSYFEDVEYYTHLMDLCRWDSRFHRQDYSSRVERVVYGRRFFITEKGSMGLAGPMAQEGDQIVLFPGQDYPFIVRDAEEKGSSTLHGDCYLHGLDVSSVELWESDPASIRQFVIV
ncbi:heterokaryon incompatibility protein-domain-containing protein [Phyllosticta capitalensis]